MSSRSAVNRDMQLGVALITERAAEKAKSHSLEVVFSNIILRNLVSVFVSSLHCLNRSQISAQQDA